MHNEISYSYNTYHASLHLSKQHNHVQLHSTKNMASSLKAVMNALLESPCTLMHTNPNMHPTQLLSCYAVISSAL